MKRLLLLTAMFLISPMASANMDNICLIVVGKGVDQDMTDKTLIEQINKLNCIRNNILHVRFLGSMSARSQLAISDKWCRFDRNRDFGGFLGFSCVLYTVRPREILTRD